MDCRRSQELLSAYYDGELDSATSRRLDEHLARCSACSEELNALRDISRTLRSMSEVRCPDDLWASLSQRIALAPPPRVQPRRQPVLAPAWSLAAAVALCAAVWSPQADVNFTLHSGLNHAPVVSPSSRSGSTRQHPAPSHSLLATLLHVPTAAPKPAPVAPLVAAAAPAPQPAPTAPTVGHPAAPLQPVRTVLARIVVPAPVAAIFAASRPAVNSLIPQPAAARRVTTPEPVRHPSRRFLAGVAEPGQLSYRPTTVTVPAAARLAPAAVTAPASSDGSFASTTPAVITPDSSSPPAASTGSTSTSDDSSVQGTIAVAENAASDSDNLAQTGDDLYGMALAAGATPDAPTTSTASAPGV